jgi:hypothetical protein
LPELPGLKEGGTLADYHIFDAPSPASSFGLGRQAGVSEYRMLDKTGVVTKIGIDNFETQPYEILGKSIKIPHGQVRRDRARP